MTNFKRVVVCAFVLATAPSMAFAQSLWGGATLGMTESQVAMTFPAAIRVDSEAAKAIGTLRFRIENAEFHGVPVKAEFYFRKNRLDSIRLRVAPEASGRETAMPVVLGLQEDNGGPPECVTPTFCMWKLPGRNVGLVNGMGLQPPLGLMVSFEGPKGQ